jgi:integrase
MLRVKRMLTRYKGCPLLGKPTTKRSRRTVRLTEEAVEALRDHLARQMREGDERTRTAETCSHYE